MRKTSIPAVLVMGAALLAALPIAAASPPDTRPVPQGPQGGDPPHPSPDHGDRPGGERHGRSTGCASRTAPTVSYVMRGTVSAVAAPEVTLRLAGGNRHARRLLGPLVGTYVRATAVAGTRVSRGGVASGVGQLVVGDQAIVVYRGIFVPRGWKCDVAGRPTASGDGTQVAPKVISAASLTRITASAGGS